MNRHEGKNQKKKRKRRKKNKQPKRLVVWFDHFGFVFFLSFFFFFFFSLFPAPPIYMIMSVWLYGPSFLCMAYISLPFQESNNNKTNYVKRKRERGAEMKQKEIFDAI